MVEEALSFSSDVHCFSRSLLERCSARRRSSPALQKQNRLSSIVGAKTAREVLGGANFKLPGGYILRMPVAGWYTWQGECIEGKGVEPDIAVENSPESLAAGADAQLERA